MLLVRRDFIRIFFRDLFRLNDAFLSNDCLRLLVFRIAGYHLQFDVEDNADAFESMMELFYSADSISLGRS